MNCFRKPQNAHFRGLFPSKCNKTTNNTFDRFLSIMNCFRKLESVHFKTAKHTSERFLMQDTYFRGFKQEGFNLGPLGISLAFHKLIS